MEKVWQGGVVNEERERKRKREREREANQYPNNGAFQREKE